MFKYLLLKTIFDVSDVDIVERSKYDMSFKYFLGMAPEEPVIEPSSLTKFRKLRLKDINLLDLLINKTVEIAIETDVLKCHWRCSLFREGKYYFYERKKHGTRG
ncbi:hypothetical protein GCM10012290_18230 [Halolactibacillus alkaliphilus]|nr:hypothetical protein GCM10012290_18230 [Halolactibacillus alkaliphilus]